MSVLVSDFDLSSVFHPWHHCLLFFFFFNDTATTEIYTLSLHDALPISRASGSGGDRPGAPGQPRRPHQRGPDRKSTRLNSSHLVISYAVFCLKKKKNEHGCCMLVRQFTVLLYQDEHVLVHYLLCLQSLH